MEERMAKKAKSEQFNVYATEAGYRRIAKTSLKDAQIYEALGVWRREYDKTTGAHIGFRLIGEESNRVDADLPHSFTSVAISKTEMEINAAGKRSSHTFRLTEPDRLARIKNGLPPEDAAERALAKVRVYPYVGAAKGDILRVWPRG
jgi:hypothetical protein